MEKVNLTLTPAQAKRIRALADLKNDEMESFLEFAEFFKYKTNEIVFKADDPADCMLLLLEGEMRVMTGKKKGQMYFLRKVAVGQSLGEISLIDGGTRSATVEASEDSLAMRLDGVEFEKIIRDYPGIACKFLLRISIQLCAEVRDLTTRLAR